MEGLDLPLQRFLQLHMAVVGRDAEALRQCLRACATELPDKEQFRVVQALQETLDPGGKAFLLQLNR